MKSDRALAKLLADLEEQCRSATRIISEAHGDHRQRLVLTLELILRATRASAEAITEGKDTAPELLDKAKAFLDAFADWERRTVQASDHLRDLAEGWQCSRCGVAVPARAMLGSLECRACGAETPLTEAGRAAFDRIFGHLALDPSWNPAANGFVRRD